MKEKIENEINELREEVPIFADLIRWVKVKSRILNRMKKKYNNEGIRWFDTTERDSKTKDSVESTNVETTRKKNKILQTENHF